MEGDVMRYEETTVATLSGRGVGISNILEDELPDENGVVAMRRCADLTIGDYKSPSTRKTVIVGSVVDIGGDRYCIVEIELSQGERPGAISIRKLAH